MTWKRIIVAVLCAGMLTGCQRQDAISLSEGGDTESAVVQQESGTTSEEAEMIYVYVCGHVAKPGVYALENGARIYDALEQAGGTLDDAEGESLDQALPVTDGQTIYVPAIGEQERNEATQKESEDGLVNINEADASALMTLPGIGESKASVIIQYREEHGAFQSIEDLMGIPGIKQGVFDKIKNNIKV